MTRLAFALFLALASAAAAQGRAMTVTDMMAFRLIKGAAISPDGKWVAFEARPDRGDGTGHVVSTDGETRREIERGRAPVFSDDSGWVAFEIAPRLADTEAAKKDDKPKPGAAVMNLETGAVATFDSVERFAFTKASTVLVLQHHAPKEKKSEKDDEPQQDDSPKPAKVTIHVLATGGELGLSDVTAWALDPKSRWLVTVHAPSEAKATKLVARDLTAAFAGRTLAEGEGLRIANPTFAKDVTRLAWVQAPLDTKGKAGNATLWRWAGGADPTPLARDPGRSIPIHSPLEWSDDGARLFFGAVPVPAPPYNGPNGGQPTPLDKERQRIDKLLEKRAVDVWHHDDPFIRPHQKKQWKTEKKRTYRAVFHVDTGKVVQLGGSALPDVAVPKNATNALGTSDMPYRKARTWDLPQHDVFTVDLESGARTAVATAVRSTAQLSPSGKFVVYYADRHWHLWDVAKKHATILTLDLDVPFFNETHDYPYPAPGYGIAGFGDDDSAVFLYDRYDVWRFPTNGDAPERVTHGRPDRRASRLVTLDKDGKSLRERTFRVATRYDDQTKAWGFGRVGEEPPHHGPHKFKIVGKAKDSDEILYTRESYTEYPGLWVTRLDGNPPQKLTDFGKQTDGIAWGSAELVHWTSQDGAPLDGVLIKPGNYEAGRRYPVVVYFYRKFSQRLTEFNEVVVNHRPCFPFYASNGYAVFLPDVNFEIGQPGASATRCLVPGIQKLVDMGIADPKRIGLHGHSWSGYQTAFVITQTDMFKTAIAGAPVSNMTSAYGGIRWKTGLSRQFQYERSQSRIGGTLWGARDLYIENSPLFFADRINTPLLIQFGDEDGAVPWYQGIELYMAMRRLEKPCVFLQYRGEPHHLKKYANKLDYTIKMKEWFDHYLKDTPAPRWISTGVPYSGKN